MKTTEIRTLQAKIKIALCANQQPILNMNELHYLENLLHGAIIKRQKTHMKRRSTLDAQTVAKIRAELAAGAKQTAIAAMYDVNQATISHIKTGKRHAKP